jgi:hypothetical protein
MTTRTIEVSDEAGDTGRRASEVRDDATGLDKAMEDLHRLMIHVVRSSTTDVQQHSDRQQRQHAA